jgi:mannosidase alpha-like ER degradation enhancer 1
LGNHSEFEKAITWVGDNLDFDLDANVSVFETNIRVLGGLLSGPFPTPPSRHCPIWQSALTYTNHCTHRTYRTRHAPHTAHLLAADAPDLFPDYSGRLLELAVDLASRLLPAFQTHTRIPYGTVRPSFVRSRHPLAHELTPCVPCVVCCVLRVA